MTPPDSRTLSTVSCPYTSGDLEDGVESGVLDVHRGTEKVGGPGPDSLVLGVSPRGRRRTVLTHLE